MNFLAHIFLSGQPGDVMAGNFMADSVKGSMLDKYSEGIKQGIRIHRAIDSFTDNHHIVLKSKERLRLQFGKYAPVVADVYFDHFLALQWEEYSEIELRKYTQDVYEFLKGYYAVFPERTKRFYDYMVKYDILFGYAEIEGIDRVMKGMAKRASFVSGMEKAADELVNNYEGYQEEFRLFFPEIRQHIRTFEP